MNTFQEISASKSALAKRKAHYGLAINDANYLTSRRVNGKKINCPYFVVWYGMIKRCYSESFQEASNTYKGCTVAADWLLFSNFKLWMEKQDWQDKELDKDILIQGNKIYSKDTCVFVCNAINNLFITRKACRGTTKLGVNIEKASGKFRAYCSDKGKTISLGRYTSEDEAHEAYKKYKYKLIKGLALKQKEPLRSAMLNYVIPEY